MSFLKKLQENRAEKVQEMETLVNTAKTEERAMAQEELEKFKNLEKRLNRLTAPLRQKKEPEKKKVSRRKGQKKSLPPKNWKKERFVIIS